MYKYVLGFDPSGAFKEGKGTTGYCLLDNETKKVIQIGSIKATNFDTAEDYWNKHLIIIEETVKAYKSVAISVEAYRLYANKAQSQTNSEFETVQLIGIIKYYCWCCKLRYATRLAAAAKNRWSNDILVHKGYITLQKNRVYATWGSKAALCDHEVDALRHALHFSYFENK